LRVTATTKGTGTATALRARRDLILSRACLIGEALFYAMALGASAGVAAQGLPGFGYPLENPGLQPGVRASATWSNNVGHRANGGSSDVILEVSPYVAAESTAPRASYRLFYQLRNFVRLSEGDTNFFRHALNAQGSFALIDDRFGVDLTGYMGTVNASPMGAISADPGSSFSNTANIRSFSVSPWYRDVLNRLATYQLRYTLTHSGGHSGFTTANLNHRASAQVDGIPVAGSKWNWRWIGEMQRREFNNNLTRDRQHSSFSVFYSMYPSLRVYGMLDYEYIEGLRNRDGDNDGYGPGAGFDWTPFERTSINGSISKRFYGTVGNLGISHTMRSATMGLRYSRSVLTSADASLLMFDPMSLTSGSSGGFGMGQPNPVITSLVSRGIVLPPGTVLTEGLFTDAAILDRRLTAFWGLRGARNALTFTGYVSNRDSTTELQSSTQLTGIRGSATFGGVFAGEIRERGIAASYGRTLDGRSTLDFTVNRRRIESPTAFFETQYTTFRVGYRTWITSDMAAFAGARRTLQMGEGRGASYNENAIYGGVDLRFY